MDSWIDCDTYRLHTGTQRSEQWSRERRGRLTASNFGSAVGYSMYSSPEEIRDEIRGVSSREMSDAMEHGIVTEPEARKKYEHVTSRTVTEVGLAVPKWDDRIGASVDGLVGTKGMIEIKCPMSMYRNMKDQRSVNSSSSISYNDQIRAIIRSMINPGHYAQIQGSMAILNREWCDYVVYSKSSNEFAILTVPYDKDYWENDLYPKIKEFLDSL